MARGPAVHLYALFMSVIGTQIESCSEYLKEIHKINKNYFIFIRLPPSWKWGCNVCDIIQILRSLLTKPLIIISIPIHVLQYVSNSRREVDMNVHVVLYLRACTYRYRCLISKICVLLTQIFLDMCSAVCLPGQLVNRYSFCVSDDLFYMIFLQ